MSETIYGVDVKATEESHRDDYEHFLESKRKIVAYSGFEIEPENLPSSMFDFQKHIVSWNLRKGRSATLTECGTGKTIMQLNWAQKIVEHTNKPVLVLTPLAVAKQTKREGEKFGIEVTVCRSQKDVKTGVNVANYDILEHFDTSVFAGVVLDESSILKNFMGKTKQSLVAAFVDTPYRLACSATPAPNDYLELGNHSSFLGVMPANEMIMRWFINDTMEAGAYRLKHHGEKDYWRWVSSWAVAMDKPSDIGFCDDGYILPELIYHTHLVETDCSHGATEGELFRHVTLSATTMHREMKITSADRAAKTADIIQQTKTSEPWLIWCNTNYEADDLKSAIPNSIEVRGSESVAAKEEKLEAFGLGQIDRLITKCSIAGFGMNYQNCGNMAFVGLSYSQEQFYQALRRAWRYGRNGPVHAHIVMADTETAILSSVKQKQSRQKHMKRSMIEAMRETHLVDLDKKSLSDYYPTQNMRIPTWLTR